MARKRIGELLVQHGMITRSQLEAGLVLQVRSRQRIGLTLLEQGAISEKQLTQVLAESLGIQTVDLRQVHVDWSAVHLLRSRFCEAHELFPFGIEGKATAQRAILVAMSDPLNQPAVDEIEFTTGLRVNVFVATQSQVREAIFRFYHRAALPAGQGTLARLTGDDGAPGAGGGATASPGTPPVAAKAPTVNEPIFSPPALQRSSPSAIARAPAPAHPAGAPASSPSAIARAPAPAHPAGAPASSPSAIARASAPAHHAGAPASSPSAIARASAPAHHAGAPASSPSAIARAPAPAHGLQPALSPPLVPPVAASGLSASALPPVAISGLPAPVASETRSLAETQSFVDPGATTPGDIESPSDFERLFSPLSEGEDGTERVERRLWALLRVLHKKGLVTREEFLAEADRDD